MSGDVNIQYLFDFFTFFDPKSTTFGVPVIISHLEIGPRSDNGALLVHCSLGGSRRFTNGLILYWMNYQMQIGATTLRGSGGTGKLLELSIVNQASGFLPQLPFDLYDPASSATMSVLRGNPPFYSRFAFRAWSSLYLVSP